MGAAYAFRRRQDWFTPYYRDLGVNLVVGVTPAEVMLSAFARGADPASGGKQMPSHWGNRPLNIVSGSSPVTTQLLHAVGIAEAARMRGDDVVVYTACGEGSSNQGDFHEALNWAGLPQAAGDLHGAEQRVRHLGAARPAGGRRVGGRPGAGVRHARHRGGRHGRAGGLRGRARRRTSGPCRGEGPTLIEAKCIRITSHSSDDDQRRYRDPEEIAAVQARDPIRKARQYLMDHGLLDEAGHQELERKVTAVVDDATDWAEAQPYAAPEEALRHVYEEG